MKAHYNIIQKSEEWHEIKHAKIGGTLSGGLFVKSDTLMLDILSQQIEDFEMDYDGFESRDMQRGNDLEPVAREQLQSYLGIEFKDCGWLQCEEFNNLIGISPDGITEDETICCEIKCPSAKKHTSTIFADEIPKDNIHQCLHYFTVNDKLKSLYFCSFRPENKLKPLFVKELKRDSLIDLGTKAKPVIKSVSEWVEIAKQAVSELNNELKLAHEKLAF